MSDSAFAETFESADAGASLTYPQQAGTIRKNAYIVINNRPCKVADVSTSKTGKHGHAKCHFVGIDIFTGKKYEDLTPSSHNCDVPNVARNEYTLIDINEDGFVSDRRVQLSWPPAAWPCLPGGVVYSMQQVSLMEENGSTRDDLKLPYGTDESEKLAEQLKIDFGEGKEIVVSVLKAMGEEMINSMKVVQSKA
ncbi:hypothetical protein QJQ45_023393 [Haematococcus lacustris]|nr:hypothetical protein QJQ45_023393 [Haematococcus lacustris]